MVFTTVNWLLDGRITSADLFRKSPLCIDPVHILAAFEHLPNPCPYNTTIIKVCLLAATVTSLHASKQASYVIPSRAFPMHATHSVTEAGNITLEVHFNPYSNTVDYTDLIRADEDAISRTQFHYSHMTVRVVNSLVAH